MSFPMVGTNRTFLLQTTWTRTGQFLQKHRPYHRPYHYYCAPATILFCTIERARESTLFRRAPFRRTNCLISRTIATCNRKFDTTGSQQRLFHNTTISRKKSNNNNNNNNDTPPKITKVEGTTNHLKYVRIGHVQHELKRQRPGPDETKDRQHLVPYGYLPQQQQHQPPLSDTILRHLQWMMAKDNLKQDMLLVGPPGAGSAYRRRLAMMYAEMTQQQVEILTLSSDITESDLKQRRELVNNTVGCSPDVASSAKGSSSSINNNSNNNNTSNTSDTNSVNVKFTDQPPVQAAIHGRLLILDGLDTAEKNVLPTLNNLLENREMNLEDGRFLISPERFADLCAVGVLSDSSSSLLIPTHKDFRVIAIAVPSPPYGVHSLDPPLRSRFQIRRIDNPTAEESYETLVQNGASNDSARLCSLFGGAVEDAASSGTSSTGKTRSFHFPLNAAQFVTSVMDNFPLEPRRSILSRAYLFGCDEARIHRVVRKKYRKSQETFDRACEEFDLAPVSTKTKEQSPYEINTISHTEEDPFQANVSLSVLPESLLRGKIPENNVIVTVPCGGKPLHQLSGDFVHTVGSKAVLTSMIQEHFAGRDILLVSPKGEGKSATATEFASILGYDVQLFSLYKEMTGRDLMMRRTTDSNTGETKWDESPLLKAARKGEICILDGLDKLKADTIGTLHGFLTDREVCLPDGKKLVSAYRGTHNTNVRTIHPSFRIIALGSFSNEARLSWITEELGSMFSTIPLPAPSRSCLKEMLSQSIVNFNDRHLESLLDFHESLTEDIASDCGVSSLSTRNLVRLVKQGASSSIDLYKNIRSVLVVDLLPPRQRSTLDSLLKKSHIVPKKLKKQATAFNVPRESDLQIDISDTKLSIGDFSMERKKANRPEMVPNPHFFDIPNHVRMIKTLLSEWSAGERAFLLLGNQGVGKNKIVDRICELANFEREYIQLHRDSSIGSLTLSPSLEDGKIIWKDSPLVRAVTRGCSLVIDEADKAPLEVISVLKSLVADGELLLADGRRISRNSSDSGTIPVHPNFTVFVLANRPGFPFHGNDFFREIGDCFATNVIPNPDLESEINLLQSHAPNVDTGTLRRIAESFKDLRHLYEHGEISYPYSTREAVAIAKHMHQFTKDDIVSVLHNVLDIDTFDKRLYAQLVEVFRDHGFPIEISSWAKSKGKSRTDDMGELEIEYLTDRSSEGKSANSPPLSSPKVGKWDDSNDPHVGGNQWTGGTGGSDTVGLGGKGGPYRLDRGHKVHQVSDEAKSQVSKEAAAAARNIAQKALKDRLKGIGMSESEFEMYNTFIDPIKSDIASLRSTVRSVESKTSERDWLRLQNHGEIDDSKLVEGVAGEKYIYKRRGTVEPQANSFAKTPRRLRFIMDCSSSMYRFNGYDERQRRCLEAAVLVMESFDGTGERFDYSIVGHSGDSRCIELVNFGKPPSNAKDRMRVLQTMVAHSQYCQSGDNTLGSIKQALTDVTEGYSNDEDNVEDCIVIAVSDANLARYGIAPSELGRVIAEGAASDFRGIQAKAYCIFIASFGSEADDIKRELPLGRGFVCMETSELPKIVRHILTSEIS